MLNIPDTIQFIDETNDKEREDSLCSDNYESENEDVEKVDKLTQTQDEKAVEHANLLNQRTTGRQTGVKGVISDYRYFRKIEKSNSSLSQYSNNSGSVSMELESSNQLESSFNQLDLEDFENLSDDEFFEQYKLKRLEELKKNRKHKQSDINENDSNQLLYNKVYELNEDSYIQVIDDQLPQVYVVIHLYQKHITECNELNEILDELSTEYQHTLFCKIQSQLISSKFDELVLPTLLVYQGGNLIHNFVKFLDELGGSRLDYESVHGCLFKYGILTNSDRTTS